MFNYERARVRIIVRIAVFCSLFNLSNFLNAFNTANTASDNTQPATDTKQTAVNHKERILPPLQSSMLNTMTSHDEFVKRVKHKHFQK